MPNEPLVMKIDGKEYKFSFPGYQVHLDSEDEIRKLRRKECLRMIQEYAAVANDAELEDLRMAILSMFDNVLRNVIVSFADVVQWINSPSGTSFMLWKNLLTHHPEMEQEEVLDIYYKMTTEQRLQVRLLGEPDEKKTE